VELLLNVNSCKNCIPFCFSTSLLIFRPVYAQRSAYDEAAFLNAAAADGDTAAALRPLKTGLDINFKGSG
jgi:hypothetical protein